MDTQVIATIAGGLIAIAGGVASYLIRARGEASIVNKAVLAEINRLLFVIGRHAEWWTKRIELKETGDFPLIPFATDVFKAQTDNIGAIDKAVIVHVVKFYGYVGYLNTLQTSRNLYKSTEKFDDQYRRSLQTILDDFRESFNSAFEKYGVVG